VEVAMDYDMLSVIKCPLCNKEEPFLTFNMHLPQCLILFSVSRNVVPYCTCAQCRGTTTHPGHSLEMYKRMTSPTVVSPTIMAANAIHDSSPASEEGSYSMISKSPLTTRKRLATGSSSPFPSVRSTINVPPLLHSDLEPFNKLNGKTTLYVFQCLSPIEFHEVVGVTQEIFKTILKELQYLKTFMGRPSRFSDEEQLLMTLLWLRHYCVDILWAVIWSTSK